MDCFIYGKYFLFRVCSFVKLVFTKLDVRSFESKRSMQLYHTSSGQFPVNEEKGEL